MDARRLIPIGAVVTALLVLAGAASHGRPLRPGSGSGPSAVFFDYVATTFFLFFLAMVVVLVLVLGSDRSLRRRQPRGKWHLLSTIVTLVGSAVLAVLILRSGFEKRLNEAAANHQPQPQTGQPIAKPPPAGKDVRDARLRWDEVAIMLVLAGGVGVYLFMTRVRPGVLRPLAERRRAAMSRAIDDSIDDLRRDPDTRRAIIAAYARMETALAHAGVPRAPAEAPFEYLGRSLVELDASADAARRLTDLFERAKFSQHEPAEEMRTEAIDALVAVRDELRRPVSEPLTA
jgi:hypothetical protein